MRIYRNKTQTHIHTDRVYQHTMRSSVNPPSLYQRPDQVRLSAHPQTTTTAIGLLDILAILDFLLQIHKNKKKTKENNNIIIIQEFKQTFSSSLFCPILCAQLLAAVQERVAMIVVYQHTHMHTYIRAICSWRRNACDFFRFFTF